MSRFQCLVVALGCLAAADVVAAPEHVHPVPADPPRMDAPRPAQADPDKPYRSAWKDYRRFDADLATRDWLEVNRTVRERGGWRAYAKDAAAEARKETPR